MKIEFEELCIQELESFYKTLTDEIESLQGNPLILDFSMVEKIDLSTIQLLISLKKYFELNDMGLIFMNIDSPFVIQTINTYKLSEYFGVES